MSERKAWARKRSEILGDPGSRAAYEAARIRFESAEVLSEVGAADAVVEEIGPEQPRTSRPGGHRIPPHDGV